MSLSGISADASARSAPTLSVSTQPDCLDRVALAGSTISGAVAVQVMNPATLRRVDFYLDGASAGSDASAPYLLPGSGTAACPWDSSSVAGGTHVLVAKMVSRKGTTSISSTFTVGVSSAGIASVDSSTTSSTTASTTTTTAAPTTTTSTTSSTTSTTAPAASSGFVHPGVLLDRAQLDFVKSKVAAGLEPWKSALDRALTTGSSSKTATRPSYRYSSLSYVPAPVAVVQSPSSGDLAWINAHPEYGLHPAGEVEQTDDARAAYTDALIWYYTGNQSYASKAMEIMNAWSSTLKEIKFNVPAPDGSSERLWDNGKLQAAWGGTLWARAGEIIRYSNAGWASGDITRFETMLENAFLPLTITGWSNGANWLMSCAETTIAIGVFTNDRATFDAGVDYWRKKAVTTIYLPADGAFPLAPDPYYATADRMKTYWFNPSSYPTGLQGETLRDLSHMMLGMGAMSNGAETARIQGVDLWGEQQGRIVAGYELAARYVNEYLDAVASYGTTPPSTWRPTGWVGSSFSTGGDAMYRGWEVAYNHYGRQLGLSMPYTKRLAERTRGKDGAFLHLSWETLTHGA